MCLLAGNGGSLEKCRRRWDLADAEFLKYKFLAAFDRAMTHLDKVRFCNAHKQCTMMLHSSCWHFNLA